jgi:hypothetical protein
MAEAYLAWGWSVFPLWWITDGHCACPRGARCPSPGKHPLTPHGVKDASRQLAQVGWWWSKWPQANVGLPAGDNGLAVLDVDPRHGGEVSMVRLAVALAERGQAMSETLTQYTGSGGRHLVFTAPPGGLKGGSNVFPGMPGLDTRGRGGYIVAAPSTHASGQRYEWDGGSWWMTPPAPWPAALSELMEQPAATVNPASVAALLAPGIAGRYAAAALEGEARRVRQAMEGSRNHMLNRAAFSCGQLVAAGLLEADQVAEALSAAATDAGLDAREIAATLRSGLRGGAAKPRPTANTTDPVPGEVH